LEEPYANVEHPIYFLNAPPKKAFKKTTPQLAKPSEGEPRAVTREQAAVHIPMPVLKPITSPLQSQPKPIDTLPKPKAPQDSFQATPRNNSPTAGSQSPNPTRFKQNFSSKPSWTKFAGELLKKEDYNRAP